MAMLTDPDALPQLIGDYRPADSWQAHINKVFYGLRGGRVREFYQTFASADYRLAHALAAHYFESVQTRNNAQARGAGRGASGGTETEKTRSSEQEASTSSLLPLAPRQSLVIQEWGPGNGNLAACFLSHLKHLDQSREVYPRVEYVLVDNQQTVLDVASAHPDLADHADRVKVLCTDVTDLRAVPDGSVDRILCNELWNDLPTKLMLRKEGEIEEEYIRPNLKEHRYAAIEDWPEFVRAFEGVDLEALRAFDPFLDDIIWEKDYRKVEWKDVPFRKTMTDVLRQLDEQVLIPVNIGAAQTIREAKRILAPGAVGLSGFDAGTSTVEALNDPEKPCYGQFGGQYSFMVNFVLLEAVATYLGIENVEAESQRAFIGRCLDTNVASLMDLLALHPDAATLRPWEQDRLILQTIQALNNTYESPYQRKIEFPLQSGMPREEQEAARATLSSLKPTGVPDTIAYLTEAEMLRAVPDLEKLGYVRDAIWAALSVPAQPMDYRHLFLSI